MGGPSVAVSGSRTLAGGVNTTACPHVSYTNVTCQLGTLTDVKLLVVEDEVRLAALMKRGLEEEGHSVAVAHDGDEALWHVDGTSFDAIVLDVMIPGPDGIEVCRRMRAKGTWTPVLMLTARTSVEDRVKGLDAGADDYLGKPFSFSELAARIRALTRRHELGPTALLESGDLVMDLGRHEVTRRGVPVDLSPREFDLLEYFLRHPDQMLTRERILHHVWDFAYDGTSNVVDQYVSYLRRKIDNPFGTHDLLTVRGIGYRLRVSG